MRCSLVTLTSKFAFFYVDSYNSFLPSGVTNFLSSGLADYCEIFFSISSNLSIIAECYSCIESNYFFKESFSSTYY